MKLKRIFGLVISIVVLCASVVAPFSASAIVTADSGTLQVLPGNTQSSSPSYSMAWLDNIIIRDDATAVTASKVVPKADYPYSKTYEEYIREVNHYSILTTINEETIGQSYDAVLEVLYYMVTALGMTDDENIMRSYISDYGIKLPANQTAKDKIKVSVVYAALRYNAIYALYNKKVEFPKGISLDGASVIILAAVTGVSLPSGVESVSGFGVLCVKNYVEEFEDLPISQNPDDAEVFHWAKILTAASNDYQVPLTQYDQTTQAQKDYVDYAYYASILKTIYGVNVNPIYLVMADETKDNEAVPALILRTMLDESKVAYNSDESTEKLFKLACENGWFNLEDEFYSDVFNYDIYVKKDCEKLWFTPFILADQLGGKTTDVKIMLGDKEMAPSATAYAPLNPSKAKETVKMVVNYDDGNDNKESVTYTFNVIKTDDKKTTENNNEILNKVQDAVGSVIPQNSDKATKYVDDIFSSIDAKLTTKPTAANDENDSESKNVISTYPQQEANVSAYEGSAQKTSDGVDFEYLNDLFDQTYPTDENGNVVTSKSLGTILSDTDDDGDSFVEKTVAVIKENPQAAVATPTSIIAIGGFLGYFLSKKRKANAVIPEETETEEEQ
ncbi:MAG: hypothetical protein NC122_05880 [Faecalibacterium sp.]|nr:hypothetical protein [Ruminococcus sp.]MCM1391854.1 hypothetical protein [Ruminococcus sp.]MCM1485718.1 hypothetical protein [Faecalibacterium sp.]